jgi:hypothetical protein
MQYYFGFGVAFNIYCDRLPRQDNDLGDALIRQAVINDFWAGMASNPRDYDFHGRMAPYKSSPSPSLDLGFLAIWSRDIGRRWSVQPATSRLLSVERATQGEVAIFDMTKNLMTAWSRRPAILKNDAPTSCILNEQYSWFLPFE